MPYYYTRSKKPHTAKNCNCNRNPANLLARGARALCRYAAPQRVTSRMAGAARMGRRGDKNFLH